MAQNKSQSQSQSAEMQMQPEEYADLRAQVADIALSDVKLGRVLDMLVLHLGHIRGLDPAVEDAKAEAEARQARRDEEDAQVKAASDARTQARAAEDAQPLTAEQQAALVVTRTAEDEQAKADADARAQARADEDAQVKASADAQKGV